MSDAEIQQCTSPEIGKVFGNDLIPTKSSKLYRANYQKFIDWCHRRKVTDYTENVLLTYFSDLATVLKSSSMWSCYSMIKPLLHTKHGVDISKYSRLRSYLKKQNENYVPKKSRVLTRAQFEKFLSEAPDEKYLGTKIVLIIGVAGACRCEEMIKIKIDDIQDLGSLLYIKISLTKAKKVRSFTIVEENFISIYRKYAALRPDNMNDKRFFVRYQDGKCYRSVMGIHKIGKMPSEAAFYLKLPHWKEFTGHCLRGTSAILLVDGGADTTCLKRRRECKFSGVPDAPIDESVSVKNEIEMEISSSSPTPETSGSNGNEGELSLEIPADNGNSARNAGSTISGGIFNNCTFNSCTLNNCTFDSCVFNNCTVNFDCTKNR